ncbi:hypothetical protein [Labrenzia sp. DG1229]|uniref:hypothetical protein n=1 Tax=Labrenzia sp. DG1229 TaxID=681847 RepID=UPI000ADCAA11|nr:hypothetical protein [Labrenzia sp. DG1229]
MKQTFKMNRRDFLFGLAWASATTLATGAAARPKRQRSQLIPPPQYDRPFRGKVIEVPVHPRQVPNECARRIPDRRQANMFRRGGYSGCFVLSEDGRTCTIVIPNQHTFRYSPQMVRRHEIGHCNGWIHN